MRRALTSAPVYTPLKFLYNSEPRTTPNTASLPETSCLSGRCSCHVCGLGAGTGVHKREQERILTGGGGGGHIQGSGQATAPRSFPSPQCCRPVPGPHLHRLARADPSTRKALLPTLHLSTPTAPPRQQAPPPSQSPRPLLCRPRALSYLHHSTTNCDCPAGPLCPLPPPPALSRPALKAMGRFPSPPHTFSRAGGRQSPTAPVGPEPGPGNPRAGRGCSRGGGR